MSRGTLSREAIIDGAIKLIDQRGLDKLSMRALGKELGVEAMSLYNHVKNKSELLDGVQERLLEQLDLQELVRTIALNFRALLKAHPGTVPLFSARSARAPGSLEVLNHGVGVFLSAGLPPDTAIQLFQIVYTYVLGHAHFYLCHRDANSFSQPESYQSRPNLSLLSPMDQRDSLDDFLLALELLISGLEQKLRKASQ
ncbi:MAG TPA: TetR family transcriptional regulator [Phycisphaerales bacterium]|nr:TetR family transcriptional regulator [Phycisphaerales bacterium]